jgi:PQQ-dependent catabolism-associated CXXCW motif protein
MRISMFGAVLLGTMALLARAQVILPEGQRQGFSYENKDWGVAATASIKRGSPHAPTPTTIPGGRVIHTLELKALLAQNKDVVVVDVLDSKVRHTVPGAWWMSGAGSAEMYGAEMSRFTAALEKLTVGDKARPVVFLCLSSECWLSYNASLRAIEAGYKDVLWYRGGSDAWKGASLDLAEPKAGW